MKDKKRRIFTREQNKKNYIYIFITEWQKKKRRENENNEFH